MDNIESKIDEILSNPKAMETIRSLSDMLSGESVNEKNKNDNAHQGNSDNNIGQGLMSMLNMITNSQQNEQKDDNNTNNSANGDNNNAKNDVFPDMQMLTKLLPLVSKLNQDNEQTRFLDALKPLVSKERRTRVEEAKRLVKLMSVINP